MKDNWPWSYRRNSDEELRELERQYASDPSVLAEYNAARIRAGMKPLLVLEWGYTPGLPLGATAAWGARAILRHGSADLLHDRQIKRLSNSGLMRSEEANEFVLYEDGDVAIVGNTNASHGYLYLVAFLKPYGWTAPAQMCGSCGGELHSDYKYECEQCHDLICVGCRASCDYCGYNRCARHLKYASKCETCEDILCLSDKCDKNRRVSECQDCGRLYCYECRDEMQECECKNEKYCEHCGELEEECEECGETACLCDPCSCNEDEEDY